MLTSRFLIRYVESLSTTQCIRAVGVRRRSAARERSRDECKGQGEHQHPRTVRGNPRFTPHRLTEMAILTARNTAEISYEPAR